MFKEVPIARVLRAAFGTGVAAGIAIAAFPAAAQTTTDTADIQRGERVEVTGSSIKRIDAETALPVQVITKDEIDRSGAATVSELLQRVSAVTSSGNITASTGFGATTGGVSTASLRGLGGPRTLVLLNGRRISTYGSVPGSGGDTAVDVNSIPISALERVEVLKDGASAIYGSDAIAGVINFILRTDYQGAEATAYYGATQQGGGVIKRGSALVGFGDITKDRFNVSIQAGYQNEQPLFGRQRQFSSSSINVGAGQDTTSGNSDPGNIANANTGGGIRNPDFPNCAPSVVSPLLSNNRNCRYDPAPYVGLVPKSERSNVFLAGRFAINADNELYAEAGSSLNKQRFVLQPVPISDQFAIPANDPVSAQFGGAATILVTPTSPYYPAAATAAAGVPGVPVLVRYRSDLTGLRDITDRALNNRGVLGAKGTAATWDYDVSGLYTQSKVKESTNGGYPLYSKILPLYNSGQVNFFGPNTAAIQQAALAADFNGQVYDSNTSLSAIQAKVSRDVFKLPAGNISTAFGVEGRRETYSVDSAIQAQQGDISGYGGNFLPVSADRKVYAAYAETVVPIIRGLEADAAVRYDHYSGVGGTTNPKVSLRYQPVKEVLLRAAYGKGFRAPSLTDLFAPNTQSVTVNGLSDPVRCPVTGSSLDCQTQFTTVLGGNVNLKPEKSESVTAGIVFEPNADISIGLDAFKINLTNSIVLGGIGADVILDNLDRYAQLVTRDATGHITSISQTNLNIGNVRLSGVDVDLKYRFYNGPYGKFTARLYGTYYQKYDAQNIDGSYTNQLDIGSGVAQGVIPRWRHIATLAYDNGPWGATFVQNWQKSYHDTTSNVTGADRIVGAYETFDVQGTYTGLKHFKFTLGIKNIMDRDPPYTNVGGQAQFPTGFDGSYADPRGRFYYGALTYSFL